MNFYLYFHQKAPQPSHPTFNFFPSITLILNPFNDIDDDDDDHVDIFLSILLISINFALLFFFFLITRMVHAIGIEKFSSRSQILFHSSFNVLMYSLSFP
ncbi:hypothetical protein ACKWTF_004591 [Chironomus riparius]